MKTAVFSAGEKTSRLTAFAIVTTVPISSLNEERIPASFRTMFGVSRGFFISCPQHGQ